MSDTETRPANNPIAGKKRNPYTVWFVVLAFIAPVALAYIMFFFVEVKSFVNHGEILNPIVHIRSVIFGNFLVSSPFTSYGGICAANEEAENLLISRAIKIAIKLNADFIEFRDEKPSNKVFPVKT